MDDAERDILTLGAWVDVHALPGFLIREDDGTVRTIRNAEMSAWIHWARMRRTADTVASTR